MKHQHLEEVWGASGGEIKVIWTIFYCGAACSDRLASAGWLQYKHLVLKEWIFGKNLKLREDGWLVARREGAVWNWFLFTLFSSICVPAKYFTNIFCRLWREYWLEQFSFTLYVLLHWCPHQMLPVDGSVFVQTVQGYISYHLTSIFVMGNCVKMVASREGAVRNWFLLMLFSTTIFVPAKCSLNVLTANAV